VRKSAPRVSITILTNRAGTQTRSVSPIREEETQLSAAWGPSPSSPALPDTGTYTIPSLSYTTKTRSLPSIRHADSSSSSILRPRSPLRITIYSNPAREKARAEPQRPIQGTRSRRNVSATFPTTTPISILKKPDGDAVKVELDGQNAKVKALLPEVVVHGPVSYEAQAKTGVHYLGAGVGTDTTSHGEILGVPVVNSRSRLQENDLVRYYPKEHASEQIVRRLRSMVRSGSRLAAAQRKERARQWGQTTTTTVLFSDLFVGITSAPASTPPPTGKMPITPTGSDSDPLEHSFPRTATI